MEQDRAVRSTPKIGLAGMWALAKHLRMPAAQGLLVLSAVWFNYGYPLVFGLATFGAFFGGAALTYVVHRTADLILESLIAENARAHLMLYAGILLIFAGLASVILDRSGATVRIDFLLICSLILSTTVVNLLFHSGNANAIFAYSLFFATANLGLTAIWKWQGATDIRSLIIAINLVSFAFAIVTVTMMRSMERFSLRDLREAIGILVDRWQVLGLDTVKRLGFASFSIFIAYGAIVVLSDRLDDKEIGALRVFMSVVFVGQYLTPVAPKLFYSLFREVSRSSEILTLLRPFRGAFFLALAVWLVALEVGSAFTPAKWSMVPIALAAYPVILVVSVLDKALLQLSGLRNAAIYIGALTLVAAVVLRATPTDPRWLLLGLVVVYPLYLTLFIRHGAVWLALAAISLSGAGILIAVQSIYWGVPCLALLGLFWRRTSWEIAK